MTWDCRTDGKRRDKVFHGLDHAICRFEDGNLSAWTPIVLLTQIDLNRVKFALDGLDSLRADTWQMIKYLLFGVRKTDHCPPSALIGQSGLIE
jgi:hypothetical protein